jgi:hypothetical protein
MWRHTMKKLIAVAVIAMLALTICVGAGAASI